jgi:C1A family cysteine protease
MIKLCLLSLLVALGLALLVALAVLGNAPQREARNLQILRTAREQKVKAMLDLAFNRFIPMYEKNYQSFDEYLERKSIF